MLAAVGLLGQLAQDEFTSPAIDWHALAPEIVLFATFLVVFFADLAGDRFKPVLASLTGIGLLAALVPVLTLGIDDAGVRTMFGGGYVVDDFSLVLKGLFVLAAYVVVLLSTNYVAEGDYWEGEYYLMVIASTLGMVVMASSRDLIGIFVALELLSIPAYMLAAWRKDVKAQENTPNPRFDAKLFDELYVKTDVSRLRPAKTAAEMTPKLAAWRKRMEEVTRARP